MTDRETTCPECGRKPLNPTAYVSVCSCGWEKVTGREATAAQRLRDYLDSLDEQTRRPGEPPLREAVAQQARERLAEMDGRKRDA